MSPFHTPHTYAGSFPYHIISSWKSDTTYLYPFGRPARSIVQILERDNNMLFPTSDGLKFSTKHKNLNRYTFTLIPNLLSYIIPIYSLPLTLSELPIYVKIVPSSTKSTIVLFPNLVFTPGLLPSKYTA